MSGGLNSNHNISREAIWTAGVRRIFAVMLKTTGQHGIHVQLPLHRYIDIMRTTSFFPGHFQFLRQLFGISFSLKHACLILRLLSGIGYQEALLMQRNRDHYYIISTLYKYYRLYLVTEAHRCKQLV